LPLSGHATARPAGDSVPTAAGCLAAPLHVRETGLFSGSRLGGRV